MGSFGFAYHRVCNFTGTWQRKWFGRLGLKSLTLIDCILSFGLRGLSFEDSVNSCHDGGLLDPFGGGVRRCLACCSCLSFAVATLHLWNITLGGLRPVVGSSSE